MSQAQVAGGVFTPPNEPPSKGYIIRDFELSSATGRLIRFSDYRGRANLVLIVGAEGQETMRLLSEAAGKYTQIKNEDAELLAILRVSRQGAIETKKRSNLPFPVLADEDGSVHRALGAMDAEGRESAAVYITDRFGEVFGVYRRQQREPLPSASEILKWLEFVNAQCPECEPPEWPA